MNSNNEIVHFIYENISEKEIKTNEFVNEYKKKCYTTPPRKFIVRLKLK